MSARGIVLTGVCGCAALTALHAEVPVPAQRPLLSRDAGGVSPNVVLTLDDSSSMRLQHIPDTSQRIGTFTLLLPAIPASPSPYVSNGAIRFHPSERPSNEVLVAAVPGTNNWRQIVLRSPDTNRAFYDPRVRYRPWVNGDGTRYPEAVVTAARLDPNAANAGTADLTLTATQMNGNWCYAPVSGPKDTGNHCPGNPQAFDAGLYYRLRNGPNGTPLDPGRPESYTEFSINRRGSFVRHPGRTDCAGTVCTQEEERQNFANWFVYHRSRLLAAKAGIGEALYEAPGPMRLGYGRINKPRSMIDGISVGAIESGVREYTPARKAEAIAWLYRVTPASATPLREAVQEVGNYFRARVPGSPWSDDPGGTAAHLASKTCRRAYHVLVTDGGWSDSGEGTSRPADYNGIRLEPVDNVDGTVGPMIKGRNGRTYQYQPTAPYRDDRANLLADYTMGLWRADLQPDLPNDVPPGATNPAFWQNLTHFTVGFGVGGRLEAKDWPGLQDGTVPWAAAGPFSSTARIDDLWHAAVNSRGEYYSAQNPAQLAAALSASLAGVAGRELREAGVATASSVLQANNRKYVPSYKSVVWSGDVEAFLLDERGQSGARVWSAREKLPSWTARRIFTWDAGLQPRAGTGFTWTGLSAAARAELGAGNGASLVDFIRGDRSQEDANTGFRVREHVLGDFVNANPVLAGDSHDPDLYNLPEIGLAYAEYINTRKSRRERVLYVGGNDGMLHAFRDGPSAESAGREIFAFVPRAVLGSLQRLTDRNYSSAHRFFVDGPLQESDAFVRAPGDVAPSWRNLLLGSTGAGARAVFALDITDPNALDAKSIRWELDASDAPELGHVLFPIETGRLPNGQWVALFGNGYGGASRQPVLFVVELETGKVSQVALPTSDRDNGLGGVAVVRDAGGQIVRLYAGDLIGNLWRLDYDGAANGYFRTGLSGTALFKAPDGQAILQPPVVFAHPQSGHIVVFGTGRLVTEADVADTAVQSLYGVRDNSAGPARAPVIATDLITRTLSLFAGEGAGADQHFLSATGAPLDADAAQGWKIDLVLPDMGGLRVIYPLQAASAKFVLATAVVPATRVESCEGVSGRSINLLLPVSTGASSQQPIFDTNGDGHINASDVATAGYAGNADGMNAILRVPARVSSGTSSPPGTGGATSECQQISIQNTTGAMDSCLPDTVGTSNFRIADRAWRRILTPPIR